jgi:hypothetical protein
MWKDGALTMGGGSAKEEDDDDDEEDEGEATSTVIAEAGAHAVSAKAEDEDEKDEKKDHGELRSERGFCSGRFRGLRGWMLIQSGGEEANTEILASPE